MVASEMRAWRGSLERGARSDPDARFPNPSRETFAQRLNSSAAHYGFQVVRVAMWRPDQEAPLVVVQTARPHGLSESAAVIIDRLDATRRPGFRTAYEGIFFEALGTSGTPLFVAYFHSRGPFKGGGEWATARSLLPLAHG